MSDSENAEPDSSTAGYDTAEGTIEDSDYEGPTDDIDDDANEAAWVEIEELSDSEEEDRKEKAKRTQKKQRAHEFLLTEADVGDEESYYENSDDGQDIYETEDEAEALDSQRPTARDIEDLRRARDPVILHMEKEQDIAEYLRNKYGDQLQATRDVDDEFVDELQQKALLPSIRDPCLWLVRCKRGKEQETLLLLLLKKLNSVKHYKVFSVVVPPGSPGFIYIEAHKKNHVEEFIQGVAALKHGIWDFKMVPVVEAPDVLRVVSHNNGKLKPGSWVRVKRGLYAGDLGYVDSLVDNENVARVQLVPRIDYKAPKANPKPADGQEPVKRKRKPRPAQKLLDQETLKEMGVKLIRDGDLLILKGKHYSMRGFLFLNLDLSKLVTSNVRPTLDELEMFNEDQEDLENLVVEGCAVKASQFSPGDVVEVVQNELTNVRGKVISVNEAADTVIVQPYHEALKEPIEFKSEELMKWFELGDQVQVIAGQHKGNTGLVLKLEAELVTIFTDCSSMELTLRRRDLQLCTHQSTGLDQDGHFQIGDLVLTAPYEVGVIVHMTQKSIRVLTMTNQEVDFKPQQLQVKRSTFAQTLDCNRNTLKKDDEVYVNDGPHTGRSGKIVHIYRKVVFIQTRNINKSGSLIVCKCHHMQLAGVPCNKGTVQAGVAPMGAATALRSPFHSPNSASTANKYNKKPAMSEQQALREMRNAAVGKTIKVIKGPFKGSIATVKKLIDNVAQVEMSDRIVMVELSHMVVMQSDQDYLVGTSPKWNGCFYEQVFRGSETTPLNTTPVHGFCTPMHGLATPMYHNIGTPSYSGGSSFSGAHTPAWNPAASLYSPYSPGPMYSSGPVYSPTPLPAYNKSSGSETPYPSLNSPSGCSRMMYSPAYSPATPGLETPGDDDDASSVYSPSHPISPIHVSEAVRPASPAPPPSKAIKLVTIEGDLSPCISIPSSFEHDVYTPRDTVNTPGYINPYGTPGGAMITTPKLDEHWAVPGLLLNIKCSADSFMHGVCRGIPTAGVVKVETENGMIAVPIECITPVAPQNRDRVAIIRGDLVGLRGILKAIDQNDGIVIINDVPHMVPMVHLCQVYQEPNDDESEMSASPAPQLNK